MDDDLFTTANQDSDTKHCAICRKKFGLFEKKYTLNLNQRMCTNCAAKIGFIHFNFDEKNAAKSMTSTNVRDFIKQGTSIDPVKYINDLQAKSMEREKQLELQDDDPVESLENMDLTKLQSKPTDVILKSTEYEYFRVNQANWLETRKKTDRVNYGGITTSIKITKNIHYRMGSIKPEFKSHDEWTQINSGKLILTNKRLIMLGDNTKQVVLSTVVNIKPYSDGIELNRSTGKDVVFTGFNPSDLFTVLSRIVSDDFDSHLRNTDVESDKFTPGQLVAEVSKSVPGLSYDDSKQEYALTQSDIVDINDSQQNLDDFRKSIIGVSTSLNEQADEPHPLSSICNDPTGNQILVFKVNGNQIIYDVTKKKSESKPEKIDINNISDENIDDLRKLKELLDDGILTQEEFDAKKKQILGI